MSNCYFAFIAALENARTDVLRRRELGMGQDVLQSSLRFVYRRRSLKAALQMRVCPHS